MLGEQSAGPSGFIKGPNVYRMGHGKHSNSPKSLSVKRIYNMSRKNQASALKLAPELDELITSQDVNVGFVVPIATADHEMAQFMDLALWIIT